MRMKMATIMQGWMNFRRFIRFVESIWQTFWNPVRLLTGVWHTALFRLGILINLKLQEMVQRMCSEKKHRRQRVVWSQKMACRWAGSGWKIIYRFLLCMCQCDRPGTSGERAGRNRRWGFEACIYTDGWFKERNYILWRRPEFLHGHLWGWHKGSTYK